MATELGSAFISVGLGTNTLAGDIKKAFGSAESSGSDAGKSAGKGFGGAFGLAAGALAGLGIGSFLKGAVSGAGELQQSIGAIDSVFKGSAGQMHEWAKSAATDVGLSANEFNELGTLIGSQLKNGGTAMDELAPKTQSLIATGADLASMFGGTTAEAVGALSSALKGERDPIERYGVSLNQAKIDAEAAALGFAKVGGSLSAEANQAATLSLIMKQTADAHGNFASEADTLAHKQQVLNAQWANGKARIGDALLPAVSGLTGALSSALGPAIDGAVAGIKKITGGAQGLYDLIVKGEFTTAFRESFNVEEDSPLVGALYTAMSYANDLIGGFKAMFAAFKAGDGDVTSSGFAGFMERVGGAAREVTGGIGAMFAAFKAGDGDVTSSGFAGVMEKIGGAARTIFDGLKETIGPLIPQIISLASAFSPMQIIFAAIEPLLPQLGAMFGQLASVLGGSLLTIVTALAPVFIQLSGVVSEALGGVIASVLPTIVTLITMLGTTLSQLIPIIVPIITTLVQLAMTLISQLMPIITDLVASILPPLVDIFGNILSAIGPVISMVAGLLIPIIQALMPVVVTVFGVVANVIKSAMQIIQGIIQVVTGIISGDWGRVWDGIVNIFSGIWNTIVAVIGGALAIVWSVIQSGLQIAWDIVTSVLGAIGQFFIDIWTNIFSFLGDVWNNIINGLVAAVTWYFTTIFDAFMAVWTFIGDVFNNILNFFGDVWNAIVNGVIGYVKWYLNTVIDGLNAVRDFTRDALGNIGRFFSDTWNNVVNGVSGFISGLINHFTSLPGKIMSALSGAGTWLLDVGKNIVQGLIDGAKGMVDSAVQAIKDVGGAMLDGVKGFLGIHSPSRVFKTQVGLMIGAGLIAGISASEGGVTAAVNNLVAIPQASAFGAGTFSAAGTSAGASAAFPDRVVLSVDGHEFTAYVSGVSRSELNGVASIAGGRSR